MVIMQGLSIKKLESEDAGILSAVALAAYADHYLDLWYDFGRWYMNKYFSVDRLTAELNDNNAFFYLVFFKGVPVGFLKLNKDAPLAGYDAKEALELERIYLKNETTGLGIGKQLLDLTTRVAEENNKKVVWLKAMDSTKGAIMFYNKMGFKITGTHTLKHPLMKEELRGMVIMIKKLRE